MYKVVQAGPNNQLGGVNQGLLMVWYQVETPDDVAKAPVNPTKSGRVTQSTSANFLWALR